MTRGEQCSSQAHNHEVAGQVLPPQPIKHPSQPGFFICLRCHDLNYDRKEVAGEKCQKRIRKEPSDKNLFSVAMFRVRRMRASLSLRRPPNLHLESSFQVKVRSNPPLANLTPQPKQVPSKRRAFVLAIVTVLWKFLFKRNLLFILDYVTINYYVRCRVSG
jgi:hypothetical protein